MSLSSHLSPKAKTTSWLTPPEILSALGPFDLDPCCPTVIPWQTATRMIHHPPDNGLEEQWQGLVWLNPPYGRDARQWMAKMAGHNNGIALLPAATETSLWFSYVWPVAASVFFLRGHAMAFIAYGHTADCRLAATSLDGQYVALREAAC
jgi:hypothetical protein